MPGPGETDGKTNRRSKRKAATNPSKPTVKKRNTAAHNSGQRRHSDVSQADCQSTPAGTRTVQKSSKRRPANEGSASQLNEEEQAIYERLKRKVNQVDCEEQDLELDADDSPPKQRRRTSAERRRKSRGSRGDKESSPEDDDDDGEGNQEEQSEESDKEDEEVEEGGLDCAKSDDSDDELKI